MRPNADWGPMVTEVDVDAEVVGLLRLWLPTYLRRAEVERNMVAPNTLARPVSESYMNALEDEEFMDARLPSIIVTTAAPSANAERDGDGTYYAAWSVVVTSVVRGCNGKECRALAALFGACVRRLLVQKAMPNLSGEIRWLTGRVAPVPDQTGQGRYLAAGVNTFTVYVDEVLGGDGPVGGPTEPTTPYPQPDPANPDQDYDPLVTVAAVTIDVQGAPIIEGA